VADYFVGGSRYQLFMLRCCCRRRLPEQPRREYELVVFEFDGVHVERYQEDAGRWSSILDGDVEQYCAYLRSQVRPASGSGCMTYLYGELTNVFVLDGAGSLTPPPSSRSSSVSWDTLCCRVAARICGRLRSCRRFSTRFRISTRLTCRLSRFLWACVDGRKLCVRNWRL